MSKMTTGAPPEDTRFSFFPFLLRRESQCPAAFPVGEGAPPDSAKARAAAATTALSCTSRPAAAAPAAAEGASVGDSTASSSSSTPSPNVSVVSMKSCGGVEPVTAVTSVFPSGAESRCIKINREKSRISSSFKI